MFGMGKSFISLVFLFTFPPPNPPPPFFKPEVPHCKWLQNQIRKKWYVPNFISKTFPDYYGKRMFFFIMIQTF